MSKISPCCFNLAKPLAINNIKIGRISIEYFVINTNLPEIASYDIIRITPSTMNDKPFFAPFIIAKRAISVGIVCHKAIDLL